jgi:hypothetical protein
MELQQLAHPMALAVGFVSSGIIGSAWALMTGEESRLGDVLDPDPDLLTPLRVLVAILSAPTSVLLTGFWWLISQPLIGIPIVAAGLIWSFLQGVFILTQLFGFS